VSDPCALYQVIAAKADEYRTGKTGLLGFFVGNVMRQSGGNSNPRWSANWCRSGWGG
jgi:Asp-tRNA(Asn)/Glu-tRNA(Gln) amidotransferase B subunit